MPSAAKPLGRLHLVKVPAERAVHVPSKRPGDTASLRNTIEQAPAPNVVIVSDAESVVHPALVAIAATGTLVNLIDSGPDCAALLRALKPKFVVIELGEAGYEGDTAWRARRALDAMWHFEPEVLALSRLPEAETRERAARVGARFVLRAPFDLDRLADRVTFRRAALAA